MKILAEPEWPNGCEHCAAASSVGHGFDPPLINACGYMICKSTWAEKGLDAHVGCQEISKQESSKRGIHPILNPILVVKTRVSGALQNVLRTRLSSCLNARGIPPAAYQVILWLTIQGRHPIPGREVTPILTWPGYPPEGTWDESLGYPQKGHGTSGSIMGWRWGTPPSGCGQTNKQKLLPYPILRMRAVKM